MARSERKMMADMRAVEEEAERMNPVNPKRQLGAPKGYVVGGSATPSMGLSTVRGGAMLGADGHGQRVIGAGMLGQDGHGQRVVGAGTKKGQSRKTARKAYEGGAEEMGFHLAQHLHDLHGAGFFDDFKKGFMSVISPVAGIAKSLLPLAGPEGMAASGVLGAIGLGKGKKRGSGKAEDKAAGARAVAQMMHMGASEAEIKRALKKSPYYLTAKEAEEVIEHAKAALGLMKMKRGGALSGAYEGKGKHAESDSESESESDEEEEHLEGAGFLSDLGIPIISNLAGAIGLGSSSGGKRKRAKAGPSDGRRKRAEIVKRVMKEHGMSMVEASKYVKAHGLY